MSREMEMTTGKDAGSNRMVRLVPMADGKTIKRLEDVTEEDIIALAKADKLKLAEKVTEVDLARLDTLLEIFKDEARQWERRDDETSEKYRNATMDDLKRIKFVLAAIEVCYTKEMAQLHMERHNMLAQEIQGILTLKHIQEESTDLVDVYRKFIAVVDLSDLVDKEGM